MPSVSGIFGVVMCVSLCRERSGPFGDGALSMCTGVPGHSWRRDKGTAALPPVWMPWPDETHHLNIFGPHMWMLRRHGDSEWQIARAVLRSWRRARPCPRPPSASIRRRASYLRSHPTPSLGVVAHYSPPGREGHVVTKHILGGGRAQSEWISARRLA